MIASNNALVAKRKKMALTGKYDFKGIKKFGVAGLKLLIASTSWGVWALQKIPFFGYIEDIVLGLFVNWSANKGLVVLNVGAIFVEGSWDQNALDTAFEDALRAIQKGRDKISPEQGKAFDEAVREAARKSIRLSPAG